MGRESTTARARAAARHRLLDGFLRRLARASDADAFALRGGALVRHWFPDQGRLAADVDLVCDLPYDLADLRDRMRRVLATPASDGVEMEYARFRLDATWPDDLHPGMRLVVQATVDGAFDELHVDITFNVPVWPRPTRLDIGGARLWVCPPATLIGRKLRVTSDLGPRFWRPKDVADLWLLLGHRAPSPTTLGEAIERTWAPGDDPLATLGRTLTADHWHTLPSRRRWASYRARHRQTTVPRDLSAVVGAVRAHLAPIVASTPGARP